VGNGDQGLVSFASSVEPRSAPLIGSDSRQAEARTKPPMTLFSRLGNFVSSLFGRRERAKIDGLRRAAELYRQGKIAYQTGRFEAASGMLTEVVTLVPANASAWYYLGRIAYKNAAYAEAIRALEQALAAEPDNANCLRWLERAKNHAAKPAGRQRRTKPVAVARPVPRAVAEPILVSAATMRARRVVKTLIRRPGPEAAVAEPPLEDLRAAVEARAGDASIRLALARRLMAAEAYDEAYRHWTILMDRGSNQAQAGGAIGRILLRRGENHAALRLLAGFVNTSKTPLEVKLDYARALALVERSDPEAVRELVAGGPALTRHRRLAGGFEAAGYFAEAESLLEIIPRVSGSIADTRELFRFYRERERFDRARTFIGEQRQITPASPELYLLEVDFMEAHGKSAEVLETLTRATEAFPKDHKLILRLARHLARQKAWTACAEAWGRAVEAGVPGAAVELAETLRRAGHYEEAVREFRAIPSDKQPNPKVSIGLSRSLRRLGRDHEAIAVLHQHVDAAPRDLKIWEELVYSLARAEREVEATAELERASGALGTAPTAACSLARMAERALLNDEAEVIFRRAAAEHPDSPEILGEFGRYFLRQGFLSEAARTLDAAAEASGATDPFRQEFAEIGRVREVLELESEDQSITVPEDLIAHVARRRRAYLGRPHVAGRVAFLSTGLKAGGGERQAALTAATLARLGPPVESVSFHCLSLARQQRNDFYLPILSGLPIEVTSAGPETLDELLETGSIEGHAELLRLFPDDLATAIATWLIEIEKRRPEIVHAWQDFGSIAGALAAILAGVPRIILSARSTRPDNKYRRLKRYMGDAYRELLGADGVIMCNNSLGGAADYESWLGLPKASIEVVYNGLDFSQLDRDNAPSAREAVRRKLGISADTPLIGGVFRLVGVKRPLLWVEAAAEVSARIPEAHFVICGNGGLDPEARHRAEELGLGQRLHFAGIQNPIAPWYGAMDLSLLASQREGLPNVLLESQYLGVPVVSSDVGGVSEVIDQGVTGWAVPNADAASLAERLIWCLEHPEWRQTASIAARAFARDRFSLDRVVTRTLEVYGMTAPRLDVEIHGSASKGAPIRPETVMEWT
jgi:glycosyltransferase involved in cell wall biosynthesis/tetratricopeptide (TPR) repeat protein